MLRAAVLLALALAFAACGASGPVEARLADPGKKAPDFTMEDLAGVEVTLSDLLGSVVVLNFWDTG